MSLKVLTGFLLPLRRRLLLFQDLPLFTENPVLFAESPQLLTLFGGQALSLAAVDLCLLDPATECLVCDA